jgi:T4 RnlA family RNA ligase
MINYSEIKKRIDVGLITSRKHPNLPYEILNYTQKVQFDRLWDEYTKICRGLILDDSHNIVARPFPKFFNLGETPETILQNLPNEIPQITEKLDGSMGILYFEKGKPSIATRGAFESEQAVWATNFIREKLDPIGEKYDITNFIPEHTYLFEIICPESKNVVDYKDFQGLVLLAVIDNEDGTEIDHETEADIIEFPYVKSYPFNTIKEATEWLEQFSGTEKEGLVCKYSNGLRLKIKSDDYKRLHKILSGFNEKDIWEALSQGKSLDSMVELVPDEFFQWIKEIEAKFMNQKEQLITDATRISTEASVLLSRKDQANYIISQTKDTPRGFSGLIFNILDNNTEQTEKSVWNILKP